MRRQLITIVFIALLAFPLDWVAWFAPPSPREAYMERLRGVGLATRELGRRWIGAGAEARDDPVDVSGENYRESGYFPDDEPRASAFRFTLQRGESVQIHLRRPDDSAGRLFAELYRVEEGEPDFVASLGPYGGRYSREADEDAQYLLLLQPELLAAMSYELAIERGGSLPFPVADVGRDAIRSVFGDPRAGGQRRHEGVDIFAGRNTPVRAVAAGHARAGHNRLGGRVVWLTDDEGRRFYYAHLEGADVFDGQAVEAGEYIGRVGNSGNARSTPTHLHFGIYLRSEGAVDPMPYLKPPPTPPGRFPGHAPDKGPYRVTARALNLRSAPSTEAGIRATLSRYTLLTALAAQGDWMRVRTADGRRGFVAARWVETADSPVSRVTVDNTALRSAPRADATIRARLAKARKVDVLGVLGGYLYVNGQDGRRGWIVTAAAEEAAPGAVGARHP